MKILVPVNVSEFGEPALDAAACTARLMGAEVHLVAVVQPSQERGTTQLGEMAYPSAEADTLTVASSPLPLNSTSLVGTPVETHTQAIEAAQQRAYDGLRHAEQRFDGVPVTLQVLFSGSVAKAVIDYARQSAADMIVMPTHGRRPFAQALLGSVAAEVVHSGVAPCLVVKPPA